MIIQFFYLRLPDFFHFCLLNVSHWKVQLWSEVYNIIRKYFVGLFTITHLMCDSTWNQVIFFSLLSLLYTLAASLHTYIHHTIRHSLQQREPGQSFAALLHSRSAHGRITARIKSRSSTCNRREPERSSPHLTPPPHLFTPQCRWR